MCQPSLVLLEVFVSAESRDRFVIETTDSDNRKQTQSSYMEGNNPLDHVNRLHGDYEFLYQLTLRCLGSIRAFSIWI